MNSNEINPYFYDDLEGFLQDRSIERLTPKCLQDRTKEVDVREVARLPPITRVSFLPHLIIGSSWPSSGSAAVFDLFESRTRNEVFARLGRQGYDVSDLGDYIESVKMAKEVYQQKTEANEKHKQGDHEAFRKWQRDYIWAGTELKAASPRFLISCLDKSDLSANDFKDAMEGIGNTFYWMEARNENFNPLQKEPSHSARLVSRLPSEEERGSLLEKLCNTLNLETDVSQDIVNDFESYKKIIFPNCGKWRGQFRMWYSKEGLVEGLGQSYQIISASRDVIAKANDYDVREILQKQREKSLEQHVHSVGPLAELFTTNQSFVAAYFSALDDEKTARALDENDLYQNDMLQKIAQFSYSIDEKSLVPIVRSVVTKIPQKQFREYAETLMMLSESELPNLMKQWSDSAQKNPLEAVKSIKQLYGFGFDDILQAVEEGDFNFENVSNSLNCLERKGLMPTDYLIRKLTTSNDQQETLDRWLDTISSFTKGNFDPDNELHRNLEYTRFRKIVDDEKVRRHIKNHFTFADYSSIFDKEGKVDEPLSEQDQFEIDCVAHEATLLRDYIMAVKERADKLGRKVMVVPNISYGYLPVSPLVDELDKTGIDTIIGVKIGSTESHSNREVINSRLFKRHRTTIANKQPVIIVVDGTYNLVTTNNRNATARYPDAHQGYLNQVIALNEAMGFTDEDYSHVGKSSEDVERLRESEEFRRAVDVYKHVLKGKKLESPYQFQLWNTAGMELAVRGNRQIATTVRSYEGNIEGPAMIFCNAGVLDEQVPEEIKVKYKEQKHKPAYFDDSGKIIEFDFGFDNFGVRYLNRLETEVKKSYQRMNGEEEKIEDIRVTPALVAFMQRYDSRKSVEEAA